MASDDRDVLLEGEKGGSDETTTRQPPRLAISSAKIQHLHPNAAGNKINRSCDSSSFAAHRTKYTMHAVNTAALNR